MSRRAPGALSPRPRLIAEYAPTGIAEVDALLGGGLPMGSISEFVGASCSGRTTLALSFAAGLTREDRAVAWVDAHDTLDPESAAAAGVDLARLLWVRCINSTQNVPVQKAAKKPWNALDQALRAADLLLQAGGFSALILDLGSVPPEFAWRIPLATWFRFRAAAERSRAAILLLTQHPCARSSAELVLRLHVEPSESIANLFIASNLHVKLERQRFEYPGHRQSERVVPIRPAKKPQSERAAHWSRSTAWAGGRAEAS